MKKRISLSLLIALLFVTVFQINVFADDDGWALLQEALTRDSSETNDYLELSYYSSTYRTIKILKDIKCNDQGNGPIVIADGQGVNINLNGKKIDRGLSETTAIENGYVFKAGSGSNLSISGTGTITGGNNTGNGGGILVEQNANLQLSNGVTVDGNKALNGGGIYNLGSVKLENIIISNNTATQKGGGFFNKGFIGFTNSTIDTCIAKNGGAVYNEALEDSANPGTYKDVRFESSKGSIQNCEAKDDGSSSGGAVYVEQYTTATFANGIVIQNCSAENNGGAIYTDGAVGIETCNITSNKTSSGKGGGVFASNTGTIFLGKDAKITGNTSNEAKNNLYLYGEGIVIIGSGPDVPAPTSGMSVGIGMDTNGTFTKNEGINYISYFSSDDETCDIVSDTNNKLMIAQAKVLNDTDNIKYATLADAVAVVSNEDTIKLLNNNNETVTISKEIKFYVNNNGKTNSATIKAGDGYTITKTGTDIITYEVKLVPTPSPTPSRTVPNTSTK